MSDETRDTNPLRNHSDFANLPFLTPRYPRNHFARQSNIDQKPLESSSMGWPSFVIADTIVGPDSME